MSADSNNDEIANAKEVVFYEALLNSWINTRIELDKSLLTLSSAGIGILITFLSARITKVEIFAFYCLSLLSFIICIVCVVIVLKNNSILIESINQNSPLSNEKELILLDRIAIYSFLSGIIFSIAIGVIYTYYTFN